MLEQPGKKADALFFLACEAAERAARADDMLIRKDDYNEQSDPRIDERGRNARFGALEGGLRTLKLAMRQQADDVREQRFYRYELQARRKRPSTPVWERITSHIYGWASDYGNSIVRPFAALAILSVAFASVYWAWALAAETSTLSLAVNMENGRGAFEFSLYSVFRPFDVWSEDFATTSATLPTWPARFKGNLSGFEWIAVRVIAAIQSFSTLVLVFLFALAVRRRFKIA